VTGSYEEFILYRGRRMNQPKIYANLNKYIITVFALAVPTSSTGNIKLSNNQKLNK
jgi:hypothetical protein